MSGGEWQQIAVSRAYISDRKKSVFAKIISARRYLRLQETVHLLSGTLLPSCLTSILTYGSIAAALAIIAWDIFQGRAGIGSFVLVYTTVQNVQSALSGAFSNLNAITDNGRYLEDYETVLAYEEEPSGNGYIHTDKQSLEIRFEHVSFTYPGTVPFCLFLTDLGPPVLLTVAGTVVLLV